MKKKDEQNKSGDDSNLLAPNGQFAKGHKKVGGIQKGTKQRLSISVQRTIAQLIDSQFESSKPQEALDRLYANDPRGYIQALAALAKHVVPTMQSQAVDMSISAQNKTIDDILNNLMKS